MINIKAKMSLIFKDFLHFTDILFYILHKLLHRLYSSFFILSALFPPHIFAAQSVQKP